MRQYPRLASCETCFCLFLFWVLVCVVLGFWFWDGLPCAVVPGPRALSPFTNLGLRPIRLVSPPPPPPLLCGGVLESEDYIPPQGDLAFCWKDLGRGRVGPALTSPSHMGVRWGIGGVTCLLYTSPSPRDRTRSRMPSSA